MQALYIGLLEYFSFLLITINFRACAKGKIALTTGTDVIVAIIGFTLIQKVAEADSLLEQVAYVIGAGLGSISGMWLTKHWKEGE